MLFLDSFGLLHFDDAGRLRRMCSREWFQDGKPLDMPHYDVCESKALQAVSLGAIRCCPRDLVQRFSPRLNKKETV